MNALLLAVDVPPISQVTIWGSGPLGFNKTAAIYVFAALATMLVFFLGTRRKDALVPAGLMQNTAESGVGFVRTQILNSRRNLPERFAGAFRGQPTDPLAYAALRERVAHGIDPAYVGELVREGIENDWPYIFTDTEFEPIVEMRFARIREGFNRIRERIPKR